MPAKDRSADVQAWMNQFRLLYPGVIFFDEINGIETAKCIDHHYREKLEESIRSHMKPRNDGTQCFVDRHKVASLYEAVIAFLRPVVSDDESDSPLNFVFAYFVAQLVMSAFNKARGTDIDLFVSKEFDREHLSLLSISTASDGFVLSNAACWYLIEKYCIDAKPRLS